MNAKVIINDTPIRNRLNKLSQLLRSKKNKTMENLGEYAVFNIRANMPMSQGGGESRRSIWYLIQHGSKFYSELNITQHFLPHPEKHFSDGRYFNLPLYMFYSDNAIEHFKNSPYKITNLRKVPSKIQERFLTQVRIDLAEQWRLSK